MAKKTNLRLMAVVVMVVLIGVGLVWAEPIVPPGYYVEPYVTDLTNVSDIAFSPGGDFGYEGELFVVDSRPNGIVYRVPGKGEKIYFTKSITSEVFSMAIAPPGSPFGGKLFLNSCHPAGIYSYDSGGTGSLFSNCNLFGWDMAFAPDDLFGNNLFHADGYEPSGEAVHEWRPNGTQVTSVYTNREETVGLAFGPGGEFGNYLYVLFQQQNRNGIKLAKISSINPDGIMSDFLVFTDYKDTIALAFDTTPNFGGNLFVAEYTSNKLLEIDPNGNVSEFASDFSFSSHPDHWHMASNIAFGPDSAMYVSDGGAGTVWRIAPIVGELENLEIVGPDDIAENSSGQYKAKAHYTGGTVVNVTDSVQWSVEPNLFCEIYQNGKLVTNDITTPTENVIISAQYSGGNAPIQAKKNVTVFSICPSGYALKFDGEDDYLNVRDAPNLRLPSKLTAEVWVYPIYDGRDYYADAILFKGENIGWGDHFNYRIAMENQNLYTWGVTRAGSELFFHGGTPIYDKWQHLAVVADGTKCRAFINGVQVASREASGPYLTFPGFPLQIGGDSINNARWFSGLIDEIRIWNRALLPQEIKSNMNKKLTGAETGLVGYWNFDFDETEGQTAVDSSGNGNDGRLGSTWGNDDNDPARVESNSPVGICSFYLIAKQHMDIAKNLKQESLELLAQAMENEFLAQDVFDQMLETREYEKFNKGDIIKAKQKIHSAIQAEEQAETAVGQSIDKLEDALDTLGIE